MTIQEILDNILHAVFGKDVRQSMHDGVKRANDICEETEARQTALENKYNLLLRNCTELSPSDSEIVDARIKEDGTVYDTLGKRLDVMDAYDTELEAARIKEDGTRYKELGDRLNALDDMTENIQAEINKIKIYKAEGEELQIESYYEEQSMVHLSVQKTSRGAALILKVDDWKSSGKLPNLFPYSFLVPEQNIPFKLELNENGRSELFHYDVPFNYRIEESGSTKGRYIGIMNSMIYRNQEFYGENVMVQFHPNPEFSTAVSNAARGTTAVGVNDIHLTI